MFNSGTKIIVLSSSKKKGLGPRKGSLGFVSSCEGKSVFDKYDVIATFNRVVFTRYGFEARKRTEFKNIISVFPLIRAKKGDIESQVFSLIKRINSPKSEHVWEEIRSSFNLGRNEPIVLACPLDCQPSNILDYDLPDFKAWVSSTLSNNSFKNQLNKFRSGPRYIDPKSKLFTIPWLDKLYNMTNDKLYRDKWLFKIVKDKEAKKTLISTIQSIKIVIKLSYNNFSFLSRMRQIQAAENANHVFFTTADIIYDSYMCNSIMARLLRNEHDFGVKVIKRVEFAKSIISVIATQTCKEHKEVSDNAAGM